jgi:hypothetical protein
VKRLNLILLILALTFVVSNPYAQKTSKKQVNSLKGGKWALSFLLGTPSNSENAGSLNLTLKSQVTKIFAIRLGASAYLSYGKDTRSHEGFDNNKQNQSSTNADIFLNFLFYTNPSKPLSFYAGLGPVYQYKENKSEYLATGSLYNEALYTNERVFALGGFVVLGAEWFAFSGFSFTAEYNLSYAYGILNGTNTLINIGPSGEKEYDVSVTDNDVQTWNFNIIKLGFTAYF